MQKIVWDRPQSNPLLNLNTGGYDTATVQSSDADCFL